jgi:micrococcal nuclease
MIRSLALALLCWTVVVENPTVVDGDTFFADLTQRVSLPVERTLPFLDGEVTVKTTVDVVMAAPRQRIRVLGIDTPERGQPGFAEATTFTAKWLAVSPADAELCQRDHFGRWLGTVTRGGDNLADALFAAGLGVRR